MIRINLLPHRELKRQARRRQFGVLCGVVLGIGALIVGLVGAFITGEISAQNDTNTFIENENKKLDDDIKEIAKLEDEIRGLKARQQAVENLQGDRNLPVHLLDELVKVTPDGIYLKSLKQSGARVSINGLAANNAKVADYVRNLTRNDWLAAPELVEIRAVTVQGKRLNDFTMNVSIVRPKEPAAGAGAPAAGAAPASSTPPGAPAPKAATPGKA